jgi:hypothetical protein
MKGNLKAFASAVKVLATVILSFWKYLTKQVSTKDHCLGHCTSVSRVVS